MPTKTEAEQLDTDLHLALSENQHTDLLLLALLGGDMDWLGINPETGKCEFIVNGKFTGGNFDPLNNTNDALDLLMHCGLNWLNHDEGLVIGKEGVTVAVPIAFEENRSKGFRLGTFIAAAKLGAKITGQDFQFSLEFRKSE